MLRRAARRALARSVTPRLLPGRWMSTELREILVHKPEQLPELKEALEQADAIGVDTEFIMYPYYRQRPQLVQLSTPRMLALLDCQAFPRREVLHPVLETLFSKELVVHHAEQDFQVLYDLSAGMSRRVCSKLFDTRIAASFLGMGTWSAYGSLVEYICGVQLDKTQALSDWSTRPFTQKQVEYALDDVRHLLPLRNELERRLKEAGRDQWFWQYTDSLLKPELYAPRDPREAWKHVRKLNRLTDPQELAILREVAAWREMTARIEDRHPTLVVRDEALISIAQNKVTTMFELGNIQGMKELVLAKYGKPILDAVKRGLETPPEECPVPEEADPHHDPDSAWTLQEFMWSYICSVSRVVGIAPEILCPKGEERRRGDRLNELKQLAEHDPNSGEPLPDIAVLKDWRKEIVGDALLAIRAGEPLCFDPATRQLRLASHPHLSKIRPYSPPPPAPLQPKVHRQLSPQILEALRSMTPTTVTVIAATTTVTTTYTAPATAASPATEQTAGVQSSTEATSHLPSSSTLSAAESTTAAASTAAASSSARVPRPPVASWAEVRTPVVAQSIGKPVTSTSSIANPLPKRSAAEAEEEEEDGELIAPAGLGMYVPGVTEPTATGTKAKKATSSSSRAAASKSSATAARKK